MRERQWLRNLLLAFTSTVVILCVAELAARFLWQPGGQQPVIRADPIMGWTLQPSTQLHSLDTDRHLDYHIQVNALGMRDPERSREAPPGTRRVLLLGDSMVFGPGVPIGQRCGDVLDAKLGTDIEVLNAAVGGWGTDQEFLYLCHEGFDLRPQVVVLGLCLSNDVINNMLKHEFLGTAPKPRFVLQDDLLTLEPAAPRPGPDTRSKLKSTLKKSRLFHYVGRHALLLRHRLQSTPEPRSIVMDAIPYYPEDLESSTSHWSIYKTPYAGRFENAFCVTERLIESMHDSCASRGIPFVLFAFPQKVEVDPVARERELQYHGFEPEWFDFASPYERLQRLTHRLEIPFVYPVASFRAANESSPLYFERDPHPNVAGHKYASMALEPVLRAALRGGTAEEGTHSVQHRRLP